MNKVQDIVTHPNALPSQQQQHRHQQTRIKGGNNNNELKPPQPGDFEGDEQRRVSAISTGPMAGQ